MNAPVGSLDAEKIAEVVLLYAFTMAFPISPYESVFKIYHFIYLIVILYKRQKKKVWEKLFR